MSTITAAEVYTHCYNEIYEVLRTASGPCRAGNTAIGIKALETCGLLIRRYRAVLRADYSFGESAAFLTRLDNLELMLILVFESLRASVAQNSPALADQLQINVPFIGVE